MEDFENKNSSAFQTYAWNLKKIKIAENTSV